MNNTIKDNLKIIEKNIESLQDSVFEKIIINASKIIIDSLKKNKKILFCGNGGSAGDSQHLSAELLGQYLKKRQPLAAVDLTSNTSLLTSVGNDISFDQVFSRQISAIGLKGDILFAITTSGKSKNIINAIKTAKHKGLKVILLASEKAYKLKKTVNLFIPSPGNRVDRIQETHIIIGHLICELVEKKLSKN
jgi:D-sedoheptulose 7-phosphate isomerase|tara:strand:- start:36 stop:611 length:576 start_codon:yes stop_codon:yes gene_type:complete